MERAIVSLVAILLQTVVAGAQDRRVGLVSPFLALDRRLPEPPARPNDLMSYAPAPTARDPSLPRADADATCRALLTDASIVTTPHAAISGEGGCGIAAPVTLEAVLLPGERRIEIAPAPVMRCDLAARFGAFVRETIAPAIDASGRKVKRVITADAYDCRSRNRQAGAKLSEHATGAAIDLAAIEFADGSLMRVTDKTADPTIAESLRQSACARFSTVLGPGSDGYHEDHIHLDLALRRGGAKICQWALK